MKSEDFEDTAVCKVTQPKAVRVAAKMAAWANTMEGTVRLVYDEDVQSNPAVKELLTLGEDEFRMRAAQLDVDSSQKALAKLLPKIRRLRAEARKAQVQPAEVTAKAAEALEPYKDLSEKQMQELLLTVKMKPVEARTEQEKTLLRIHAPMAKLRRDEMVKQNCGIIHETGSAPHRVDKFYLPLAKIWSWSPRRKLRLATNELPAIAKALEDGLSIVLWGPTGTGKTSLAMAVADAWAKSKQQSEWYFVRSMEAIKEVKQRMKAESIVVLDEASARGNRHVDYVKALLSSDSANLDARNKDVVLPPKVRRILTCQELDRVDPCLKGLKSRQRRSS